MIYGQQCRQFVLKPQAQGDDCQLSDMRLVDHVVVHILRVLATAAIARWMWGQFAPWAAVAAVLQAAALLATRHLFLVEAFSCIFLLLAQLIPMPAPAAFIVALAQTVLWVQSLYSYNLTVVCLKGGGKTLYFFILQAAVRC